ncbi:hypothetical protein ERY13_27700 [Paenibacillus mucilaginosus]|uniref:hypothetical protein n=1 Tax=Paenibacillus mucilaginosus TaxID=61624 RepID=UPI00240D1B36|nr:hypothetical protein [Paenibacillus mucilaginosus]WFA20762.1 hypothetical protein ERY13_27700 [Paenibacillus mucilaginosus]
MKFVEFLLSNWFILVIGYILVTSFLRKARGGGGEEQPPRRAMPPFGGGGEGGWPTRPAAPPAARRGAAGCPAVAGGGARPAKPERERLPEPEPAAAAQAQRQKPQASRPQSVPAAAERPSARWGGWRKPLRLRPQDAAQGLLWAEVLGPPRAKRPYRR